MVYNAADNLPAVAMIFKKINSSGSMQLSHSLVREGGSTGKGSQPTTDFLHPLLPLPPQLSPPAPFVQINGFRCSCHTKRECRIEIGSLTFIDI